MTADQLRECREAFENWYQELLRNPLSRAYNNPLDMPSEGDMRRAMEMGFQAAWNTRPTAVASHAEGEVVAYCEPDNPFNSTAFAWPGSERDPSRHTQPLYANPPRSDDEAERTVKENLTVGDEARDAARYRRLRENWLDSDEIDLHGRLAVIDAKVDSLINKAAMAARGGE